MIGAAAVMLSLQGSLQCNEVGSITFAGQVQLLSIQDQSKISIIENNGGHSSLFEITKDGRKVFKSKFNGFSQFVGVSNKNVPWIATYTGTGVSSNPLLGSLGQAFPKVMEFETFKILFLKDSVEVAASDFDETSGMFSVSSGKSSKIAFRCQAFEINPSARSGIFAGRNSGGVFVGQFNYIDPKPTSAQRQVIIPRGVEIRGIHKISEQFAIVTTSDVREGLNEKATMSVGYLNLASGELVNLLQIKDVNPQFCQLSAVDKERLLAVAVQDKKVKLFRWRLS